MSQTATFTEQSWDNYAKNYDSLLFLNPYKELCENVARLVTDKHTDIKILDVGCGTGNISNELMGTGYKNIVGLDNSRPMLDIAKSKCGNNLKLTKGDLNKPFPFPDKTFDVLVSNNVLYAVANPKHFLTEAYRILSNEGRLILVTPKTGYDNGLILKDHCQSKKPDSYWQDPHTSSAREELLLREALRDKDEDVITQMLLIAKHNREIATTSNFHFFSMEDLRELVKNVGFSITNSMKVYANQGLLLVAEKGGNHVNT